MKRLDLAGNDCVPPQATMEKWLEKKWCAPCWMVHAFQGVWRRSAGGGFGSSFFIVFVIVSLGVSSLGWSGLVACLVLASSLKRSQRATKQKRHDKTRAPDPRSKIPPSPPKTHSRPQTSFTFAPDLHPTPPPPPNPGCKTNCRRRADIGVLGVLLGRRPWG